VTRSKPYSFWPPFSSAHSALGSRWHIGWQAESFALLDQSTRTIELMEKWVDERNSAMTDTTKQGATVGGEGEMEIRWIGGNCPVQAEGTIDGKEFYFRARGDSWSMDIGGDDPVAGGEWSYEEDYGKGPYDAGWMTIEEARGFIAKAVAIYRAAAPNANERE
jgi:hypothetical protein